MHLVNFQWDQDGDGVVTLTWDMPDRTLNVLSMAAIAELSDVADKVTADAGIKGLVITSAKSGGFCAGADLDEMLAYSGAGRKDAAAVTLGERGVRDGFGGDVGLAEEAAFNRQRLELQEFDQLWDSRHGATSLTILQ